MVLHKPLYSTNKVGFISTPFFIVIIETSPWNTLVTRIIRELGLCVRLVFPSPGNNSLAFFHQDDTAETKKRILTVGKNLFLGDSRVVLMTHPFLAPPAVED